MYKNSHYGERLFWLSYLHNGIFYISKIDFILKGGPVILKFQEFNLKYAGIGSPQVNKINNMAADISGLYITRASAAMVLTVW